MKPRLARTSPAHQHPRFSRRRRTGSSRSALVNPGRSRLRWRQQPASSADMTRSSSDPEPVRDRTPAVAVPSTSRANSTARRRSSGGWGDGISDSFPRPQPPTVGVRKNGGRPSALQGWPRSLIQIDATAVLPGQSFHHHQSCLGCLCGTCFAARPVSTTAAVSSASPVTSQTTTK